MAHDAQGDLLLVAGTPAGACAAYERALELDAGLVETRTKLRRARGSAAGSAPGIRRRRSGRFAADLAEAETLEKAGDRDKAESIYRRILRTDPDNVDAIRLLAATAVAHERFREAEVFLKRAVELAPEFARAWVDLANVQRHLDQLEEASASVARVVELSPDKPDTYMLSAAVLGSSGRHDEAIAAYEKVLSLDAGRTGAMCAMAHHLKTLGRQSDAIESYRNCIAVRPSHGEAWWSLANLKTYRFSDGEIDAMFRQLDDGTLDGEARLQIHNALGFAFEGRGQHEQAFDHFAACNGLRRAREKYDPVDTESTHDRVIELFDQAFLQRGCDKPVAPVPIFIVGLPRSGSTLIEQILASHSLVEGTYELPDLARTVHEQRRSTRPEARYPDLLANLGPADFGHIGTGYVERSAKHRHSALPCFIDKNPNNFVYAGLIRMAMPNAKVINARRHPLDSCLGTFKQLFASGQPFSYDLVELGEYYLQYQRLMDHWQRILPGFVLDVHYESVVADLDAEVRRLLDFCGLPFEESCLRFHETDRPIKTASSEQVRRPIYAGSVNLWRRYEPWLGELIDILAPVLAGLPEADRPHA